MTMMQEKDPARETRVVGKCNGRLAESWVPMFQGCPLFTFSPLMDLPRVGCASGLPGSACSV